MVCAINFKVVHMINLLSTMDETQAKCYEGFLQRLYNGQSVYRFQYQGIDGLFHYEILINPYWLSIEDIERLHKMIGWSDIYYD